MKIFPFLAIVILFLSCSEGKRSATNKKNESIITMLVVKPEFQLIIDSCQVEGSVLIYDLNKDVYYSNNFERAKMGHLPASTFKIANSIIALEAGVVKNDSTLLKWDGKKRWMKKWEQDLILRDAFHFSCVPCYQDIARSIGVKRMNAYLTKMKYGSMKVDTSNLDMFWLEGDSRITQFQQIDFLKSFYRSELPISERTEKIMKRMFLADDSDQYKLSEKTGLSNTNGIYNGWYVGYIEFKSATYFFATNIEAPKDFDFNRFVACRKEITMKAIKQMGLIK
ncbi:class D beta-lactamase [Ancylomarina salipaludis]|uniref:Beta-lactamase n=1 Tax=Ancylomarina salipaludis TaxID=2501299 RepID=A0A4Q1JNI3_9BACT|nr:class D beta-lactamase [Ancylomarina salipaludis]RXQ95630.1 class D beta-lactamase [Ancylomarina salipaludis]